MTFSLPPLSENVQMTNARPWSVRMADSMLALRPVLATKWDYDWGVLLKGIERVWRATGNRVYLEYIRSNIDRFVGEDGRILGYVPEEYNIDRVNTGKVCIFLYEQTGEKKYRDAVELMRAQLNTHPRTNEGGFWHKKIYPHQMWLDGLYMGSAFYAEYTHKYVSDPQAQAAAYDDVLKQVTLMETHLRDPQTGLFYHGWDQSRQQRWANPDTGCSPHFWGRAMGWYAMAVVDIVDYFPPLHPGMTQLRQIFERLAKAVTQVQDPASGLWYQILDAGGKEGNYLESSGSSMLVYALAKAVRLGILPSTYLEVAKKGYLGLIERQLRVEGDQVYLENTCGVAGLGGDPYRDGSYAYYVGEKIVTNDYKGVGPFMMACAEMEALK